MIKVLLMISFYSFTAQALTFNNSMELAEKSFYPFYYDKYYQWQKEYLPCLCKVNEDLDKFTTQKLKSYTSWSLPRPNNVKRQNFQILFQKQAKQITKSLILNITNADFNNPHFNNFLRSQKISLDITGKILKSFNFNYFSQELQFTYVNLSNQKWHFISFKNGKVTQKGMLIFPIIEKSFSNKYIPYLEHFVHQEKFEEEGDLFFTRTYLKVFNILSLPKDLQLLMLQHNREWNLDSVTIYTNSIDDIGVYYP